MRVVWIVCSLGENIVLANKLVSYLRSRLGIRPKNKIEVHAPFVSASGLKYEDFFAHIHHKYVFDWYMEIGCRKGTIFAQAQGKTIAVDPYFRVSQNVIGNKPAIHVFQTKSDDFFASEFLQRNEIKLSVSFLDGMHLIEFLLRDFINTERHSHPDGVIIMHDCCPYDAAMTTRDLENLPEGSWTGDVWKLLPILREYRPNLTVTVLNCAATGLVLVSGLEPENDTLSRYYDDITRAYQDIDLESFGIETFFDSFEYTDAQAFVDAGAPVFAKTGQDAGQALKPAYITP